MFPPLQKHHPSGYLLTTRRQPGKSNRATGKIFQLGADKSDRPTRQPGRVRPTVQSPAGWPTVSTFLNSEPLKIRVSTAGLRLESTGAQENGIRSGLSESMTREPLLIRNPVRDRLHAVVTRLQLCEWFASVQILLRNCRLMS